LFAVVIEEDHIEERVKKLGSKAIETEHAQKLRDFRSLVLGRMVRFWRDPRDIKLAILETIAEFSRRDDLVGWIPGDEAINGGALAEEIARLTKENAELRERVSNSALVPARYNGLDFEEMNAVLTKSVLDVSQFSDEDWAEQLKAIAKAFGHDEVTVLHLFWMLSGALRSARAISNHDEKRMIPVRKLMDFGLAALDSQLTQRTVGTGYYKLTDSGLQFLIRLRLERNLEQAEAFILKGL
jgi:hypothetical protein